MKKTCLLAAVLAALMMILPLFAFAEETENAPALLSAPNGNTEDGEDGVMTILSSSAEGSGVIAVAARGLWTEFPENSIPAYTAVAGTGLTHVMADVSKTSDGVLVCIAPDAGVRMLGAKEADIGKLTYGEIRDLPLKARAGGAGNGPYVSDENGLTAYVPTLEQALAAIHGAGLTAVLKLDAALAKDAAALAGEDDILYLTGKTKAILSAAEDLSGRRFMGEIRSNVIFSVHAFHKKMKALGAQAIVLKTTNRYGVNYYRSVLSKFILVPAADCSDPETAGHREDTVKWWDDLISRGYGMIFTDDPVLFGEYLQDADVARGRLEDLYVYATEEENVPPFNGEVLSDYKKAYTDAVNTAKALLEDPTSSLQGLRDAAAALRSAMKLVETNYADIAAGVAGKTVTPARILLCLAFAAAVVVVQIYFFKKRQK